MNKKIYSILIAMVLLFPIKGFALDNATISCNKTKLNKNEETTCQIVTGNLGYEIASFQGKIVLGDNLSLTSSSYDSNKWMYFGDNFSVTDIEFATKNSYLLANNLSIATFKIKASSNASGSSKISLTNINISDKNYSSKTLTCNPLTISFTSSVNTLSNLSIKEQQINFNKDVTTYSFTTNLDYITISGTPTDSNANVSGTGQINLKYGLNEIKIVVTAEDGSRKEYTLKVTKNDNRSSNNNLKSLSLSDGKISFVNSKTTYNVEVDSKIETITIKAELEDSKANFVQGFEPRKINLKYGANKVLIKVRSENNQEKVYTLNINRKDDRSNNNYLKEIELSNGKIKFDKNTTEYKVSVPYETQNFTINAIAEDKKSKVEVVGETELLLGENIFTIKVTAENEEVKEYKIMVTREEKIEITSSNKLKNIEIDGYKLDFDPNEYYYVVKTNSKKLNIKVTLEDKNSTYKINGNNDLKDGSIISIIVTDKDGNNNIYKLMIVEKSNTIIYIIITLLLMLLSVCLTIFIMKRRKKDNDTQNKDDGNNTISESNLENELINNINVVEDNVEPTIISSNDLNDVSTNNMQQINDNISLNNNIARETTLNQSSNMNSLYNNYSSSVELPKQKEETLQFNNINQSTTPNVETKKYCRICYKIVPNNASTCPWCGAKNE